MKSTNIIRVKKVVRSLFGNSGIKLMQKIYASVKQDKISEDELFYMELTSRFISKGSTVLDIGANVGLWTETMAKKVGGRGKILAFEPIQETYNILKKKTSKLSNVVLYNHALSDLQGQKVMVMNPSTYADASAAVLDTADQLPTNNPLKRVEVSVRRLDDFSSEIKNRLSFIKIDVEGHELNVIKGGATIIKNYLPVIFIEILREKWIDNIPGNSECSQLLESFGYQMKQIQVEKTEDNPINFHRKFENFIFIAKK